MSETTTPIVPAIPTPVSPINAPKERPYLYFCAILALGALWTIVGLKVEDLGIEPPSFSPLPTHWLIWLLGIGHFIEGYRSIDENERAGILVLGKWTWELPAGPILAPYGLCKLVRYPARLIQKEFPGEPEKVYHGHGDEVPAGLVPPIRITFSHPTIGTDGKATNGIPLDDALNVGTTNEVSWFGALQIGKGELGGFYVNSGGLKNAFKQVEDVGTAQLGVILTQQTPREALLRLQQNNEDLTTHIRTHTRQWGVTVGASIKLVGISLKLNTDILGIAQGIAKGQQEANRALGQKRAMITLGEGEGGAAEAKLTGIGKGQAAAARQLGVTGADVLAAETASRIGESPSTTVVVGTDGFANLLGAGAAIGSVLTNTRGAPPTIEGSPAEPSTTEGTDP